jgi:RNA polymerase sigma-70 factor (ECF subfamily)
MAQRSSQGITQLLERWSQGDEKALDQLTPLVYAELHRLAGAYLRRERREHTLQPTALVNEAYLKLVDQHSTHWQNRAQFFGVAAQLMRRILIDHARSHYAKKPDADLLALHDALNLLAEIDPDQSRIIELRFFGGLTIEETAEVMHVSDATIERESKLAKAWLKRELTKT